jgi:L-alanine-DL-glutamate epimerase-like enolase superfamily enzyme
VDHRVTAGSVSLYTIPTDSPEADGTFSWASTSMVLVQLECGPVHALGYSYADHATAVLARKLLTEHVIGSDPLCHPATLQKLLALWDLRARLLGVPLVSLLGQLRPSIPVYGSGGFTSYSDKQLAKQLGGWAEQGFSMVKMKIGSEPNRDPERVITARRAISTDCKLFVDANGAYTVTQAIELAHCFAQQGVCWFEEPVSSDNLLGLDQVRRRAPLGMDIAAGEYGYTAWYFRRMIDAQAVTILQADCTRCGGISGFLDAASLCWAHDIPLSSHCGPSMHLHVCCAVPRAIHMEFFYDHARIERMFFDGFCEPRQGQMAPDLSRPGMGLELKTQDAEKFRVTL